MLDRACLAGISVLSSTATIIAEDLASPANRMLARYNDALRELVAIRHLRLADCSLAFHVALGAPGARPGAWLTEDGVHLNARGETTMARAILAGWADDAG